MARLRREDGRRLPAEAMAQLRAVGTAPEFRERARKARRSALLIAPLVVGVLLINRYRIELFNLDEPVRLACSVALLGLGLAFARDAGRAIGPALQRRMDPGTAGTIGFLLRLTLLVV